MACFDRCSGFANVANSIISWKNNLPIEFTLNATVIFPQALMLAVQFDSFGLTYESDYCR